MCIVIGICSGWVIGGSGNSLRKVKFGFSEKATKFEKVFIVLLARASCSVCKNSVLVKMSTEMFQNESGQVVLYKLLLGAAKLADAKNKFHNLVLKKFH